MTVISEDCFIANLEKAMQDDPIKFGDRFWGELSDTQPVFAEGFGVILMSLATLANRLDDDMRQEGIEYAMLAACGILYKSLIAQIEADEMKEVWG